MIHIPEEIKPLLNQLLRYYRRNNDDPSFLSKNFILDENNIEICDLSTLSRIESNKTRARDDIYFLLFKKLHRSFTINEDVNHIIKESNRNLLMNAEVNNVSKICIILEKTIELLHPFKDCMIYHEYLELYELIHTYYVKQEFNKEKLDKYITLYDVIAEELRPIFISIAYHYYSRVNIEENLSIDIAKLSLDLKCNSIITVYLHTIYYVRTNEIENIIKLSKHGAKICKENNNKYYLTRFYNTLSYAYRFDDPQKAIHYLTLCIANYSEKNDPYSTLSAFYHNMAYLAYDRKDYSSILYIYNRHLYDDVKFMKIFYYLLIKCIECRTKDIDEIKRIITIVKNSNDEDSPVYLKVLNLYESIYFEAPIEETTQLIEDVSNLYHFFTNEDLLKNLLIETIYTYCKKNNAYQTYLNFKEKFQ